MPGVQRRHRSGVDPRPGDRRRRPGGARRRGLRRLGGARRAGDRGDGAGRAGGVELEDRELPRLSHRHLGAGAGGARLHPGAEVRGAGDDRQGGDAPGLRQAPLRARDRGRPPRAGENGDHRVGGRVPQAGASQPLAIRGGRALSRRHFHGGAALRRRGGDRGGGRQLGRPGRGLPRAERQEGLRADPLGRPGGEHVALPDPAHRGPSGDRAARLHRDRGGRGGGARRAGALPRPERSRGDACHPPHLRDDRRRPQHPLARGMPGARRQGVHQDRPGPDARGARRCPLAARPGALSARNQPPGGVRGGGRALRQRQAGGLGGGGGIDRRLLRPPRLGYE